MTTTDTVFFAIRESRWQDRTVVIKPRDQSHRDELHETLLAECDGDDYDSDDYRCHHYYGQNWSIRLEAP